jgi:alkylation response protein AidB-like acyl-CoA dehydrogenase
MSGATDQGLSVSEFEAQARAWLDTNAKRKTDAEGIDETWGVGPFSVSVFHALTAEEERSLLDRLKEWNQLKATKGYHAITWPVEFGGLGLSKAHARAYGKLESEYEGPGGHETISVTTGLIAPTINLYGTDEQKAQYVAKFLSTEVLCAQLFSEPGAGSDLAALGCRAVRDGDEWILNGQKVWSSGALFAEYGEVIVRSDVDVPKHKGMTAFIVPMDLPGMEIRPIKQMSGGSSFNEVFFNDVRVHDSMRLGPVGEGWKVALTTLGFERDHSSSGGGSSRVGGSWKQLLATANAMGVTTDPGVRSKLIDVYMHNRVEGFVNRRAADNMRGGMAGPEGSLGKILWTEGMTKMSEAVSAVLGARLIADTGEWGTYAWGEHVLGAPGYRIAGGSDEVQRNILGERVLGLPGEPRVDKDLAWKDVPK